VSESQKSLIGKSFEAKVGNATSTGQFEVVPVGSNAQLSPHMPSITDGSRKNYQSSNSSPLHELLGREPARSSYSDAVRKNFSADQEELSPPSTDRPFPSRVLRGVIQP
jgi:hypothetical protein